VSHGLAAQEFGSLNPRKQGKLYPVALFNVYLDESENATGDRRVRLFTIAGYVGFAHHFAGLAPQWMQIVRERLEPLGIDRMHMSPFEAKDHGFERVWAKGDEFAHELLRDFISVIHSCEIQPVGASLPMEYWESLPKATKEHYKTPFYPMMQAIIYKIAAKEHIHSSDGVEEFSFIFDSRNDVVRECELAYEQLKKLNHFEGRLMGEPVFMSAKTRPELQAADILAYNVCKAHRNTLAGDSIKRVTSRMLQEKREIWHDEIHLDVRIETDIT
jgi:hypothetical protein